MLRLFLAVVLERSARVADQALGSLALVLLGDHRQILPGDGEVGVELENMEG